MVYLRDGVHLWIGTGTGMYRYGIMLSLFDDNPFDSCLVLGKCGTALSRVSI